MAVSEVRGKCEFCQYVGQHPSYTPCASCYRDEGRPGWRATGAAVYALRLESDLSAAREELAEALPDAQRFRALIRMSEERPAEWHVGHHKGHPPDAHVVHLTVLRSYFTGATFCEAFDKAIAALGQEVPDE